MPYTADQLAALDRLLNFYDGDNAYNPATNPGGLKGTGYILLFEKVFQDIAKVMKGAGGLAQDAQATADQFQQVAAAAIEAFGSIQGVADAVNVAQTAASQAQSAVASGRVGYDTLAQLNANLSPKGGAQGEVYGDGDNNGTYTKVGAAGVGSWVKRSNNTVPAVASVAAAAIDMFGEMFDAAPTDLGLDGGAVARVDANARAIGFTVPANQHGRNTALGIALVLPPEVAAALAGHTITLRAAFQLVAGTAVGLALVGGVNVFDAAGNLTPAQGLSTTDVPQAGLVVRTWSYTVTANDRALYAYTQIASTSRIQPTDLVLQANSFTAYVSAVPFARALSPAAATQAVLRQFQNRQEAVADLGDFSDAVPSTGPQNGAVTLFSGAAAAGLTIPAGQTGQGSYFLTLFPVEPLLWQSIPFTKLRVKMTFTVTPGFSRTLFPFAQYQNYLVQYFSYEISNAQRRLVGTRYRVEFDLVTQGAEYALALGVQVNDGFTKAADESFQLTDLAIDVIGVNSDTLSPAQIANRIRVRQDALRSARAVLFARGYDQVAYVRDKVLAASGGDYTSVAAAVAAMTDLWAASATRLVVKPGTYATINPFLVDYLDLEGTDRARCILDGTQAASTALASITSNSAVNAIKTTRLANLTILVKNGRYAVHNDSTNTYTDRALTIENCHVEHLGNAEAVAYQAGLGASGNPGGVWAVTMAYGGGQGSGCRMRARRSTFKGVVAAVSNHNNIGYTRASGIELLDCELIATADGGYALILGSLGSGQADFCQMDGCKLTGDILLNADGWFPTDPAYQPADHRNFSLQGAGNSPAVFTIRDFGRALRVTSADLTNASAVAVSGTAAAPLLGAVTSRPGSGGIAGYVYGYLDVSGQSVGPAADHQITSLGYRLGDCSTVSKTLTVSFQGGAGINITFNADMRAVSNATILAQINAALGASGAADLFAVGELYRPRFHDEELSLLNNGAVGIRRGMLLAYDGHHRRVRAMTATDEPYLFAGVAWEDIYPGTFGRVKTSGYLPIADVLRSAMTAFTFGKTFSIDPAKPGYAVLGGTAGLLPAIRSDAVAVRAATAYVQ